MVRHLLVRSRYAAEEAYANFLSFGLQACQLTKVKQSLKRFPNSSIFGLGKISGIPRFGLGAVGVVIWRQRGRAWVEWQPRSFAVRHFAGQKRLLRLDRAGVAISMFNKVT